MTFLSLLLALSSSAFAGDRIPASLDEAFDVASLAGGWTKVAAIPLGKSTKTVFCKVGAGCELRGPKGAATPLALNVSEKGLAFRRGEGVDALKLGEKVIFVGTQKAQILDAFRALDSLQIPGM